MAKRPTIAQLQARLAEMERSWIPRQLDTVADHRLEPPSMLAGLSADRVHAAITAAEQGDTKDLFAIYRDVLIADTHIQGCIETRFLSVVGDDPMIAPADKAKPEDVAAAEAIKRAVDRLPDFLGVCSDLLWGTVWPLAVIERTYQPMAGREGLAWDWAQIAPVPDHLFRWTNGHLEIEQINPQSRSPSGQWGRPDPRRYITHRGHMLRTPDNWGGPMRALTWWFFLKVMDREWWVRFLDKYGTPFMVGKFDRTDERSRQILERAFKLSTIIGGVVVNKETSIELLKAGTSDSAEAYAKFMQTCDDAIARRILGQTLSSTASPQGLGNGAAGLQGQVRGDIVAYDKKMLAQTIRAQLFRPWLRLNGFTGAVPILTFGGEQQEENSTTAEVLSKLKTAGLRVADESLGLLSGRIGLEIERDPNVEGGTALGPGAENADAAAATGKLQATGMNGAQVASLVQVIGEVAAGSLPPNSARELLRNAFPLIPEQSLESMLTEAVAKSKASPPLPLSAPRPRLSRDPAAAAAAISREAAASLSQIYRGSLAPARQIILESATPEEAQEKLLAAFVDWDATKAAEVVETAITAGAWNGTEAD